MILPDVEVFSADGNAAGAGTFPRPIPEM